MKCNDNVSDISADQLKMAEIVSQCGNEIYQQIKKKFPTDSFDDINMRMNSLESAIFYFVGNEVSNSHIEEVINSICDNLKSNAEKIKKHRDVQDKEIDDEE